MVNYKFVAFGKYSDHPHGNDAKETTPDNYLKLTNSPLTLFREIDLMSNKLYQWTLLTYCRSISNGISILNTYTHTYSYGR